MDLFLPEDDSLFAAAAAAEKRVAWSHFPHMTIHPSERFWDESTIQIGDLIEAEMAVGGSLEGWVTHILHTDLE